MKKRVILIASILVVGAGVVAFLMHKAKIEHKRNDIKGALKIQRDWVKELQAEMDIENKKKTYFLHQMDEHMDDQAFFDYDSEQFEIHSEKSLELLEKIEEREFEIMELEGKLERL